MEISCSVFFVFWGVGVGGELFYFVQLAPYKNDHMIPEYCCYCVGVKACMHEKTNMMQYNLLTYHASFK